MGFGERATVSGAQMWGGKVKWEGWGGGRGRHAEVVHKCLGASQKYAVGSLLGRLSETWESGGWEGMACRVGVGDHCQGEAGKVW